MSPLRTGATLTIACHMKNSYFNRFWVNKQSEPGNNYFLVVSAAGLAVVSAIFLVVSAAALAAESAAAAAAAESAATLAKESAFTAGASEAELQAAKAAAIAKTKSTFFIFCDFLNVEI
jgi:hypothetical protein